MNSSQEQRRICIVGSGWTFTSGISYYTCRLATALQSEFEVSAILMRRLVPQLFYPGRKRVGICFNDVDYPDNMARYDGVDWFWGTTIIRAAQFLRREKPHVIVFQWWTGAVLHSHLALAAIARRAGASVVIEFHESQDTGEAKFSAARLYTDFVGALLVGWADAFIVHSSFDQQAIGQRFDIADRPVYVAPHGPYDHHLSNNATDKINRTSLLGENAEQVRTVLLFFGTIRPYKGLEVLVEAFDRLSPEQAAKLHLVIVGETWEGWGKTVDAARASRNCANITIVNRYVDDDEVSAYFALSDVVVLPYTRSSASGPLHIAMAYGMPVILSDVGGLREGAGGYDGVIWVKPGDVSSLLEAVIKSPDFDRTIHSDPRSWTDTVRVFDQLVRQISSEDDAR